MPPRAASYRIRHDSPHDPSRPKKSNGDATHFPSENLSCHNCKICDEPATGKRKERDAPLKVKDKDEKKDSAEPSFRAAFGAALKERFRALLHREDLPEGGADALAELALDWGRVAADAYAQNRTDEQTVVIVILTGTKTSGEWRELMRFDAQSTWRLKAAQLGAKADVERREGGALRKATGMMVKRYAGK